MTKLKIVQRKLNDSSDETKIEHDTLFSKTNLNVEKEY